MLILSIETSCDETAAAVTRDGRTVLSSSVYSQIATHAEYGGVVPEIASRRHVEKLCAVADSAVAQAGVAKSELDAVAVTAAPGLIGALLTGLSFAKGAALALDVPLILIDIPHLDAMTCDADRVKYIRAQFDDCIAQLEAITGKKMDYDRLKEVMDVSQRSSRAWLRAVGYMSAEPSPFSGFDIFNNMAVACVGRGTVEAAEAFEQLADEYEALAKDGKSTFKGEEKYRILFEGIACWSNLKFTYKTLQSRGINLTASIYGPAFSFLYGSLDELMAAYSYVPNSNCFERELQLRVDDAIRNKVDGAIFHMNRSCKHWSGNLYEMERQFREKTGVPTVAFDGDQSDPRCFSEAQYETRIDALVELMEENKRKEGGA